MQTVRRLPHWMKMERASGERYPVVKKIVESNNLHTICTSGNCPNIGECWNAGTATFMILGDICTRSCRFCGTKTGRPLPPDLEEPQRLAEAIKKMKLNHCVITSVDRDDLADGGADLWASSITLVKRDNPGITIETLIPDFSGREDLIRRVIDAGPDVISHNIETVRRLTPAIRSGASYNRSMDVIRFISSCGVTTKSGFMLGLGETEPEIFETMDDLLAAGCHILTIGQYLKPGEKAVEVVEYVKPDRFERYRTVGLEKGFRFVESAPLVRSSFHAEKHVKKS